MGTLKRIPANCLFLCFLLLSLQGMEILDPDEVEYIRLQANGTVGGNVTLECGSVLPTIFIWGYARAGSPGNVALAYNYGQGPKVQPPAHGGPAHLSVPANTSALRLEQVSREAEGTYTCQALYDADQGARITFYYTQLVVSGD